MTNRRDTASWARPWGSSPDASKVKDSGALGAKGTESAIGAESATGAEGVTGDGAATGVEDAGLPVSRASRVDHPGSRRTTRKSSLVSASLDWARDSAVSTG